MARQATEGIRVKASLKKRLEAIQKQVEAAGSQKPTFTGIIEAWEAGSDPREVLATLIKKWSEPTPEDLREDMAKRKRAKP